MTWEIFTGITVLIGFLISIIGPFTKLTKTMTELTISVQALKEVVEELGVKNNEAHKRIWGHNDEQDERLDDHEKRIMKVEYDIEKYHGYQLQKHHYEHD